jgi:hypothetical protein
MIMTTMPVFVFGRRPDIEREAGFDLAGQLVVDIPKGRAHKKRNQKLIQEICWGLQQMAAAGRISERPGDLVIAWPNGRKPDDAADVADDEVMAAWAERSTVIGLRVGDPVGDGKHLLIDSDAMSQIMGTPPTPAEN